MKYIGTMLLGVSLALIVQPAMTQSEYIDISLSMNGAQVPTASAGIGSELGTGVNGCYYDSVNNVLYIKFQYSGLTGTVSDAHIHGPAASGVNAGVLIGFTGANGFVTGATSGSYTHSFTLSSTNETRLLTNLMYVNLHTTAFGGGEIRGQLVNTNTAFPVELTFFGAVVSGRGVELAWKTATETNNHGFEIQRSADSRQLNAERSLWSTIGFVEGNGTTNTQHSYSFVDASARGNVHYRLKQIDRDGKFEYSNSVEATVVNSVTEYSLGQNYPNPFNPVSSIRYQTPVDGFVSLKVYDMLGKEVASLVNGFRPAGENVAEFNAAHLPSGLYFYTLRSANYTATKKMLLVK